MRGARSEERGPLASPQPPSPSPQPPRRAISLTEVLIAMGILTLGLLGVAAVFPVGSWYMQKADDRRPGLGHRPIGDERHRGPRDAQSAGVVCDDSESTQHDEYRWNTGFPCDGKYSPDRGLLKPARLLDRLPWRLAKR